jgi:hypothetical protein
MADLRKYARGKPCMIRIPGVCNGNPETTVLAHVRMAGITGTGQKAPDQLGAWACSSCHDYVDGRAKRDEMAMLDHLEGVIRTQYQLIKDGVL